MTDHKFTDEQIIEVLQIRMPHDAVCRGAYDLINRQKEEITRLITLNSQLEARVCDDRTEIERLTVELDAMRGAANSYKMHYENARAEAIKLFAERLKECFVEKIGDTKDSFFSYSVQREINNLVKEMTEENK